MRTNLYRSPGLFSVYCSLDDLNSSSDFQSLQFFFQVFWACSKQINYNCYHHYLHVPQIFLVLWQGPTICLYFLFHFQFVIRWNGKVQLTVSSLFLLLNIRSGLLAGIMWSVWISKSQRILNVSFSRTDSSLCVYHLVDWLNFNFLHKSQWITVHTQSCLVLYSFLCYFTTFAYFVINRFIFSLHCYFVVSNRFLL